MTSRLSSAASMTAKLYEKGVDHPDFGQGGCWAVVRRYTGSKFPQYTTCGNRPRDGHLTCRHHADREDDAQRLKVQS